MSQSLHHVKGIGEVLIVRRKGTRRLSIRMRPFEPIRCLTPPGIPKAQALQFVEDHREWIKRHKEKIDGLKSRQTLFDDDTVFSTRFHKLKISRSDANQVQAVISNREIHIEAGQNEDLHAPDVQDFIRQVIEKTLRIEAKSVLPYRLASLAREHNLSYTGVSLRAQRRRWGSCSSADRINLNVHLMRLPDYLTDYVLLHELAHTVHKNHSKAYWSYLDQLTGGRARALDKEMRRYSPTIY